MLKPQENFRLERLEAPVGRLTVRATCNECGASFQVDLYHTNLKSLLEDHAERCPGRRHLEVVSSSRN